MISNEQIFAYLKTRIKHFVDYRHPKTGGYSFTCPNITKHKYSGTRSLTAEFKPSGKIACVSCEWEGTIYDAIRVVEESLKNKSDAEVTAYLIEEMKLSLYKELDAYANYGFALVPLLQNSKIPYEKGWTEQVHKDKVSWIKWLNNNLNIGIRTGEVSNITVIDVDNKGELSPELKAQRDEIINALMLSGTLIQTTPSTGAHFVFKYDKDLRQTVNIAGLHIDIRNDGGQIVCAPSKIETSQYKWENLGNDIKIVAPELKTKLLELMKVDNSRNTEMSEELSKPLEPLKLKNNNLDGCCNDTFVSIGGMLIKKLNPEDTEFVLNIMNRYLLAHPMPANDIKGMIGSLTNYADTADETQEKAIYAQLKLMQTDVTANDIMGSTQLSRAIVNKYLAQFVKEGKAVRMGHGRYQYKEKIEWDDKAPEQLAEIDYEMPLFNKVMTFQTGDVLLLGGKTNEGKTTIAMNMLKGVIDQNKGIKPYYIYSEAGSRFQKTSALLGITGKYYHTFHANPLAIELEYNGFTVIDWLHLEHKENTDTVLKHLNDELRRKGGILVIFTQLKTTYEWFAPNLIDLYPAFAARLMQDNESKTASHYQCDKIKEPLGNWTTYNLECEFDPATKIFKPKEKA